MIILFIYLFMIFIKALVKTNSASDFLKIKPQKVLY